MQLEVLMLVYLLRVHIMAVCSVWQTKYCLGV